MPAALYAISYRPTASLVALCSFEQQDLADEPAWARLLTMLVGARLPISLSTGGAPIELATNELACDLVQTPSRQDLEAVLAEPYRFRVSVDPDAPGLPPLGDGKEKVLRKANRFAVGSIALIVAPPAPARVKVMLSNAPPDGVNARLLFEGRPPATRDPQAARDGTAPTDLFFTLPSDVTITPGASYGMVFLMEGAPVEARSVRAPDITASTAGPPPTAPAPATAAPATAAPSQPRVGP